MCLVWKDRLDCSDPFYFVKHYTTISLSEERQEGNKEMIFNVPGHIEMIRNGLKKHPPISHTPPKFYVKTQTRRATRGKYQVGRDYAVQRKRGVKAETDIRIVMAVIWQEKPTGYVIGYPIFQISKEDALAEGGYDPISFEQCFESLGVIREWPERWAFGFHVIEVQK